MEPIAPILLLTRPEAASRRFVSALQARKLRFDYIISPLLEIVPRDVCAVQLPSDLSCDVALTSEHGARRAAELGFCGRAWCVGERTRSVAEALGFDARSADGNAADLRALIAKENISHLVHLRGLHGEPLGNVCGEHGSLVSVQDMVVYEQRACDLPVEAGQRLCGSRPLIIPLFSPRSACLFLERAQAITAPHIYIAMSDAVADNLPTDVRIAKRPDLPSMVDELVAALTSCSDRFVDRFSAG